MSIARLWEARSILDKSILTEVWKAMFKGHTMLSSQTFMCRREQIPRGQSKHSSGYGSDV